MNTTGIKISLMDELAAICAGRCIWCEKNLPHPAYSQCSQRETIGHEHRKHANVPSSFVAGDARRVA